MVHLRRQELDFARQPAEQVPDIAGIARVPIGHLVLGRNLLGRLAGLQLALRPGDEVLMNARILQVGGRRRVVVAVDDGVDVLDARCSALASVSGIVEDAAAVVRVDERQSLAREQVADVRGSERGNTTTRRRRSCGPARSSRGPSRRRPCRSSSGP